MRCFVAIELPARVRQQLAGLRARLAELDRTVRWTRPEQIHLTLKFFGDLPDREVARVSQATREIAASIRPFELEIAGIGCFPASGPPRVIWTGLTGPPPPLLECQRRCEEAYAALGYPPEGRRYMPHLTIGRTRDGANARLIRPALKTVEHFTAGTFPVRELVLFQSIPGAGGHQHVPLVRAELGQTLA